MHIFTRTNASRYLDKNLKALGKRRHQCRKQTRGGSQKICISSDNYEKQN